MHRPILYIAALVGLALTSCTTMKHRAAAPEQQTAHKAAWTITKTIQTDYLLYLPRDYDAKSGKRWPLILFLHGSGERGTNVWKVTTHGPPKLVKQGKEFPFIIVSPQCPPGERWSTDALLKLLDDITTHYAVDPRR